MGGMTMTQEEKELLIKDLCARLLYDVQGITSEGVVSPLLTRGEADWDILTSLNYRIVKHGWKPFLRPMSSMTEEERTEYFLLKHRDNDRDDNIILVDEASMLIDWLNKYYFDYRGLIEKGLALEAHEGMYNTKTE